MKTRFLSLSLIIISLSIGCVEEEDSKCFTSQMELLKVTENAYKNQIARIRDPDGWWTTLEQCLEQKDLAQRFLDNYKEDQKKFNSDSFYSECSPEEKRIINNVFERLIIEMDGEININYSCN